MLTAKSVKDLRLLAYVIHVVKQNEFEQNWPRRQKQLRVNTQRGAMKVWFLPTNSMKNSSGFDQYAARKSWRSLNALPVYVSSGFLRVKNLSVKQPANQNRRFRSRTVMSECVASAASSTHVVEVGRRRSATKSPLGSLSLAKTCNFPM